MKMFQRIAYAAIVAASVSLLASCANDEAARSRVNDKPARYAMTLPQIKDAAQKGDADAQYALGFMYYYGKKVERDMSLAKKWIRKAAAQGQSRAITAMKLLGDKPSGSKTQLAKESSLTKTTSTKVAAMKPTPEFKPKSALTEANRSTEPKSMAKNTSSPINKATPNVAQKASMPTESKTSARVAAATTTPAKVITDKQVVAFEKWLMNKQDDHFTLQLLGSRNLDQVEKVIQQNHLANKSAIYHTMYKSKPWYVLVYGDYETPDDALAAIDRLPPMAQQLKPWVKPFASVKIGIRMSEHTV